MPPPGDVAHNPSTYNLSVRRPALNLLSHTSQDLKYVYNKSIKRKWLKMSQNKEKEEAKKGKDGEEEERK